MLKKIVFLLALCNALNLQSQMRYGNEWIDYSQQYFKILVAKDGIYRINYSALQIAGIPLSSINPVNFQLYHLGKEVPIYIAGESDHIFDNGDFIEFYGEHNDGKTDSAYYVSSLQANPYYSFVSDTTAYFLTWSNTNLGKRVNLYTNTSYSSFTSENYYIHHSLYYGTYNINVNDNGYNYGQPSNGTDNIYGSEYSTNEGYTSPWIGLGGALNLPIPTDNYYKYGPKPTFSTWLSGTSNGKISSGSSFNHHIQLWFGASKLFDDSLQYFYTKQISNLEIDTPIILGNTTSLQLKVINDLYLSADWNTMAFADIAYPRTFELNTKTSRQYNLTASQQYISWNNYGTGPQQSPLVYDIANNYRLTSTAVGTNLKIIFPLTNGDKNIFMCDTTEIVYVNLKAVNLVNVNPSSNYSYLIITHSNFLAQANDYKSYNATRYENFNTLVVTSEQLYDEFYYGLHHPLAIRHFSDYILENAPVAPKYLLLMGKGEQTNLLRNPFNYDLDFVPSIGVPSSDHMFTAGLKGSLFYEPAIPTGRIACKTGAEANNYLQKLKDYESLPDTTWWKKNILHLLGGEDISQANSIASIMNSNALRIQNPFYGGSTTTYNKNSTSPIDSSLEQKIQTFLNQGVGLMTFFGHGSLNETDIKFGDGCQLNNYKKYPVMYMNGCNVGNCNIAYQLNGTQNKCPQSNPGNIASKGEVFILEKDRGAIVWLAQSNTSSLFTLATQVDSMYSLISKGNYGLSLGSMVKQMIIRTQASNPYSAEVRNHSLQLIYQGDPALRLFSAPLPDYKITNSSLFLYPYSATSVSDSFAIAINISNAGKAINDTLEIKIKRTYGNTVVDFPIVKTKASLRNDTFYFYIKSKDIRTTGNNKFEVWIDPSNIITEGNELNNYAQLSVYLPGNGVNLIFPSQYSITDSTTISLVAQSSNLLGTTAAEFYFELDTTPYFSSAALQRSALIKENHLARWPVVLDAKDSTVYYWRAKLNLADTAGGYWQQRSFTYVKQSSEGWNQSHFLQYTGIQSADMIIDTSSRTIKFFPIKRMLTVHTSRYAHCGFGYILDGYQGGLNSGVCGGMNLVVMEFNQFTLDPQLNYFPPCQGYTVSYKQYNTFVPGQQDSFKNYINGIKVGQFVGIFTRYNPGIVSWDTSMFRTIEQLGFSVTKARGIKNDYTSFVAIGQKGGGLNGFIPVDDTLGYVPGLPQGCGLNSAALNPELSISTSIIGSDLQGSMTSETIGPATSWSTVYRRYTSSEAMPRDTLLIDVVGVSSDKTTETVLFSALGLDSISIHTIDAKQFPYLKLTAHLSDSKNHTAPSFLGWQVRYVGIPEGTLDPSNKKFAFIFTKDTLNEGDSLKLKFAFINISKHNFLSPLQINYSINDINKGYKQPIKLITDTISGVLHVGDTMYLEKSISTLTLSANNILDVFVNPQSQLEESYANNNFSKPFYVINDRIKPILDVTFDGFHIRNNDIVSSSPAILITVKDENKSLLLNDTSKFLILLTKPNAIRPDTITLNNPDILFTPASKPTMNKAIIEFTPKNLPDGVYSLRVQAYDRVGNISGANMYEILFEVVNKQTATRFYPYPNPFSTAMHFVFTITGKVPDNIYVQISTITGKVVKTVTKAEMGTIHIGTNITEWAWDGTDMYGDKLANGVYLYKVFLKENGQDVELNQDIGLKKNEKFFIKDIGKIYILR